jgi:hypothetical protein
MIRIMVGKIYLPDIRNEKLEVSPSGSCWDDSSQTAKSNIKHAVIIRLEQVLDKNEVSDSKSDGFGGWSAKLPYGVLNSVKRWIKQYSVDAFLI